MIYMGSKNRIAKDVLPIILADRKEGQWYVEPFVGGANMIDKVEGNRIGADNNKYLIELLKKASTGWMPPVKVTEAEYNHIKNHKDDYPPELVAYVGFVLTFGGKWFAGWARGQSKPGIPNDYSKNGYNNAAKQYPKLKGIKFYCVGYQELDIPPNSIIYCDPPYQNATKYKTGGFDHNIFWEWVREKSKEGHKIFVSEYNAPDDFECVWEKEVKNKLKKNNDPMKSMEKLFVYKGVGN